MSAALNGWTPERLYQLKSKLDATHDKVVEIDRDVGKIKETLETMQSDEMNALRAELQGLRDRSRRRVQAVLVPFLCACIPAAVVLITHA